MKPRKAWESFRAMPARQRLRFLTRPAHIRWTLLLAVLASATGWPWFLLPSLVFYVSRLVSWTIERLLWSVRAKLAAFYLNAAMVPLLLFVTILLLFGYLVLWNTSARVVEDRLINLATWGGIRSQHAQQAWWQARAAGKDRQAAADVVLRTAWDAFTSPGQAAWVREPSTGRFLASRGDPSLFEPLRADWLGNGRFAGLTTSGAQHDLELRTSVLLTGDGAAVEIGSAWRLDADVINRGVVESMADDGRVPVRTPSRGVGADAADARDLHGDVGGPGRSLRWVKSRSDSAAVASGILAIYQPAIVDSNAGAVSDSARASESLRASNLDNQRARIASRFPVLLGHYLGHPVDWRNGRTHDGGPSILIAFSVEAGVAALLSTSYEAETVVVWGALTVAATLLLLLLFATLRGLLYARSISASVGKLDQGVRAIQRGDFGFRIDPREKDQLGALANGFNGMAGQLQVLLEEQAEHRVVEHELEIARAVQSRLFPQVDPSDRTLEATGICVPALTVSGDYYDYIPTKAGWDLVVADVSGKGMSAALMMASLQASLRGQYGAEREAAPDPASALNHVNRHLGAYSEPTRFVTLFLARYEGRGEVVYCNAGHNPAVLLHEGQLQWLHEGGLMLGPFPERLYETHRVAVSEGDLLCLYTDGITEAMDLQGELYGEERLATLLLEHATLPVQAIRQTILQEVQAWRQGGAASDDVTFVLLRIRSVSG